MLELSPRGRVVFAAVWLGLQGALVLSAGRRADYAFGFRMFPESSTLSVHLSRVLQDGSVVPVQDGVWEIATGPGTIERARWTDRVKDARLAVFDRTIPAAYGADAQLARFQAALDDVATHTPNDHETKQLVADIVIVKNGRAPYGVRLTSMPR